MFHQRVFSDWIWRISKFPFWRQILEILQTAALKVFVLKKLEFDKGSSLFQPISWMNGRVHFVVFEKFTSAYLFQIAGEKSCDYLY